MREVPAAGADQPDLAAVAPDIDQAALQLGSVTVL
jgi:hypothetical protein